MKKMLGKITIKGQITIPAPLRKKLGLNPGDFVEFSLGKTGITISNADRLDAAFLNLSGEVFSDWNSKSDEAAFRDL